MFSKYKASLIAIVFLVAIIIVACSNIQPSATKEDITVEASLQINNTTNNTHKEYLIDINIIKKKDSHVIIYPYIDGLGMMTYSTKEKEGYFIPGSIGSDPVTESVAITELKNNNLIEEGEDVSLVGFWFPDEAGEYKARIYLDKLDSFKEIKDPVLVCVYREEKYGKELTWAKIVPITFK